MNEVQKVNPFDLKKAEGKAVEFIPFGASEKIKLTVAMVQTMLAKPTRGGHKCSEGDAIKFMMLCRSRALNPFEGDAYIVGYDGANGPEFSLITSQQAFLKRAEACSEFDGMESGVVVRDEETGSESELHGDYYSTGQIVVGGWARVYRKDRKYPKFEKLRMATFNKGISQWKSNPEGMIVKCAEAAALRAYFPTKLGGLYIAEEMKPANATSITVASPEFTALPEESERVQEPPKPAEVPNPELGAKKAKKPSSVGRLSLIDDVRAQLASEQKEEAKLMEVLYKRQFVPAGTTLDQFPNDLLQELLTPEVWKAVSAEVL